MPFPASAGSLSEGVEASTRLARDMKAQATRERDRMAVENVPSSYIITIELRLRGYRAEFDRIRQIPGIGPYAQEQLGNPSMDVAAEFNGMIAGIDGVISWIRTNFPVGTGSAAGYLLERTWGAGGPVERSFTPAQTAGLRTQLDALIATIV